MKKWFLWLNDEVYCKNLFNFASSVSVILVPILVAFISYIYQADMKNKELEENKLKLHLEQELNKNKLSQEYIKIALDILNKKPTDEQHQTDEELQIRTWAVDIINYYSDPAIKMSKEVKNSLISNSLFGLKSNTLGTSTDDTTAPTTVVTLNWDGNARDGYNFELEVNKGDNHWESALNVCKIIYDNEISVLINMNREYRWKVLNLKNHKQTDWKKFIIQ